MSNYLEQIEKKTYDRYSYIIAIYVDIINRILVLQFSVLIR